MALPKSVKSQAEKILAEYCVERIPLHARSEARLSFAFRGGTVTLIEERPPWRRPSDEWTKMAIARFRYGDDGKWTLYCADRNSRWHEYWDSDPSSDLQDLLDEVDDDPTGIFWG